METKTNQKPRCKSYNKPAYVVFVLAGIYFLAIKDFSQAFTFWGISIVFDPFNLETPFQKRPLYQRAWLIVHLVITLALFGLMLLWK